MSNNLVVSGKCVNFARKYNKSYRFVNKMETVFDHNITTLEWSRIREMDKDEYLKTVSPNTALFDLAALFYYRGKRKKAETYINQIENVNTRTTFWRLVTHQ